MTNSATLIGLVPAIHAAGWLLPQLFTAAHTARLRRYKRTVLMMTIHERVPFLGFALVALLLPKIGLQAGLVCTFVLLTWQGLGGGFTANSWTSMVSKIIPPESRGTFFGTQARLQTYSQRRDVGAGYILDWFDTPVDFMVCFLIACFSPSWVFLA
jgi:MFS family permease